MHPAPTVRRVARGDVASLARVLARAFDDDPLFRWILPGDDRASRLEVLFEGSLRAIYLERPDPWTTADRDGAALWLPPGGWRRGLATQLRVAPSAIRAMGSGLLRAASALRAVEEHHLQEPHHYLAVLGVDPGRQGRGIGRALLEPVLSRCDHDGLPAYLETAKEGNLGFYRRCGFEVTGKVELPSAPPIWLMRRAPRTAS